MAAREIKLSEPLYPNNEGMLVPPLLNEYYKNKNLILTVQNNIINQENSSNDIQDEEKSLFTLDLKSIKENKISFNGKEDEKKQYIIISHKPNKEQNQDISYLYNNKKNQIDMSELDDINGNKLFSEPKNKEHKQLYIKGRKSMKDNMRKRIKSDFYRKLKKNLNDKIKALKLNESIDFAQYMIIDVTQKNNIKNLNMTLKEVLLEQHKENCCIQMNKDIINKYLKKDHSLDIILEKQIKFLFNEYLNSEEFQLSIKKLSEEEYFDYISKYIKVADNFINFFINEEIEKNNEFHIFNKVQNDYKSIYINQKPIFSILYPNIGKRDSERKYLNRKKIRTNFYKFVVEKLNELSNSKKFSFLQSMKSDKKNKEIANLTLKTVLDKKNYFSEINENLNVEEQNNKNNKLDTFLNMTIKDIYKKLYLNSEQYSLSIKEIEEEKVYSSEDIYYYKEEAKKIFDFK